MALKATIYKANIQLSDMDRHYYDSISLTIARHPSETEQRLMVRLLAYVLNAEERLQFAKGLNEDDEPEIWLKSYAEEIEHWIELGQIDEKRIKKACSRSKKVTVFAYGSSVDTWWSKIQSKLTSFKNLNVYAISEDTSDQLLGLLTRSMELQCSIDSGQAWLGNEQKTVLIEPIKLLES